MVPVGPHHEELLLVLERGEEGGQRGLGSGVHEAGQLRLGGSARNDQLTALLPELRYQPSSSEQRRCGL